MADAKEQTITWTQWGHKLVHISGQTEDGYDQCVQCGCMENSEEMAALCLESRIMEDLGMKVEAAFNVLKAMKEE